MSHQYCRCFKLKAFIWRTIGWLLLWNSYRDAMFVTEVSCSLLVTLLFTKNWSTQPDMDIFGAFCQQISFKYCRKKWPPWAGKTRTCFFGLVLLFLYKFWGAMFVFSFSILNAPLYRSQQIPPLHSSREVIPSLHDLDCKAGFMTVPLYTMTEWQLRLAKGSHFVFNINNLLLHQNLRGENMHTFFCASAAT